MELICSPGRERGEGFGAAEGRAGLPLWEDDERGSGHLLPADEWEGQGGEVPGWAGLRRTAQILLGSGAHRDMLCLIVEGPQLKEG